MFNFSVIALAFKNSYHTSEDIMKFKCLLSKLSVTTSFLFASHIALAQINACPSIEDLKNFSGFSIEYPTSLDINTQEPLSWLVAQTQIHQKKHLVQSLILSPVKPNQGEYALDAAKNMIDGLEPLSKSLECTNQIAQNTTVCGCAYWNPNDGSVASYISTEYKTKHAPSLATQLKMSTKLMSSMKALKK